MHTCWRRSSLALLALIAMNLGVSSVHAQVIYRYRAHLDGSQVVPPTPSEGVAELNSYFLNHHGPCGSDTDDTLFATVQYATLRGTPTGCHIHRGLPGANGERLYTIFAGWFPPYGEATIKINLSDCPDFESFRLYIIITTDLYPDGEIRGQIFPDALPVEPSTWGSIKATYR